MSINEAFFYHKPVLITGGAGFIGSHLAERLVALQAQVTIIDDLSTGDLNNLDSIKNNITFISGSINDYALCTQAVHNQAIIFHCAAVVSVPQSLKNPRQCHDINVTGTFSLLEAARNAQVERFIFSSSAAVYGPCDKPCIETMTCNPISPYGYSKLMGEYYCQQYAKNYQLKTLCLRYFNVYGPRQKGNVPHASLYAKVRHHFTYNLPIVLYGDGMQTRDFIQVEDVVEANLILAQLPESFLNGQAINVATGTSTPILEMITLWKKEFSHYEQSFAFAPARSEDIPYSSADCTKLRQFYESSSESYSLVAK